jgi:hypothetical protein
MSETESRAVGSGLVRGPLNILYISSLYISKRRAEDLPCPYSYKYAVALNRRPL